MISKRFSYSSALLLIVSLRLILLNVTMATLNDHIFQVLLSGPLPPSTDVMARTKQKANKYLPKVHHGKVSILLLIWYCNLTTLLINYSHLQLQLAHKRYVPPPVMGGVRKSGGFMTPHKLIADHFSVFLLYYVLYLVF